VGPSVLELHRSRTNAPAGAVRDVRSAWQLVGPLGRALAVGVVVACVALSAWWLPMTGRALGTAGALAVLVAAALVDAVEHRLPNVVVGCAAVPVALALAAGWGPDVGRSVAIGALLMAVPLLVTHLAAPAGMGFGDVKAGVVLGAALGLLDGQLALVALVLGLGAGALWGLTRRARSIPLGPALVLGAVAALVVGRLLGVEAR
jgi:leader peptidase (prepilin peptidase) / N-methyltransferase